MNILDMMIYRSRNKGLSVRDQTLNCVQGTANSYAILWSGKKPPIFTAIGSLPPGFTLTESGTLSYDGTACQPASYPIAMKASDSTDEVEFTMTVEMTYAVLKVLNGLYGFERTTAGSHSFPYECLTSPTFTVTGDPLPVGVTLSPEGVISYDGMAQAEVTANTQIQVTADYAESVTMPLTVKIMNMVIPSDYLLYMPMKNDMVDRFSHPAKVDFPTGSENGFENYEGVDCYKMGKAGYRQMNITNRGDDGTEYYPEDNHSISFSIWAALPENYEIDEKWLIMGYGSRYCIGDYNYLWSGVSNQMKPAIYGSPNIFQSETTARRKWSNYTITYNAEDNIRRLYVNGLLAVEKKEKIDYFIFREFTIKGAYVENQPAPCAYYASARAYNRTLTDEEVMFIYQNDLALRV